MARYGMFADAGGRSALRAAVVLIGQSWSATVCECTACDGTRTHAHHCRAYSRSGVREVDRVRAYCGPCARAAIDRGGVWAEMTVTFRATMKAGA